MTDIASLGLSIDSSGVTKATTALDSFEDAANTAAVAADKLETEAKGATGAVDKLGTEVADAATGLKAVTNTAATAASAIDKLDAEAKGAAVANDNLAVATGKADAGLKAVTNTATTAAAGMAKLAAATKVDFMDQFAKNLTGALGEVNDSMAVGGERVDQLRAKYNPLFAAQKQYKQELGDLRDALHAGAISQDEYAEALTNVKISFIQQIDSMKPGKNALAAGAEETTGALGKIQKSGKLATFELINLSRQFQDVGVGLVGGQSPIMIAAQQLPQIFDIFSSSKTATVGGAFKQIGAGIASILTPTRLLVGGLATLAIGFAAVSLSVIKGEKAFDDLSRSTGTAIGNLHALQSAAAFKGIDTQEFAKGMDQFAGSVYQAQHGMGQLADVFRANNVSAKSFTDYLEKASDLIKNAGSDQARLQLLQQMGLPATMDWVRFLGQGKDAIRAATAEATKFDDAASANLVASARRFDDAWNKAWKNFSDSAKSSILIAVDGITRLYDKSVPLVDLWKNNGIGKGIDSALSAVGLQPAANKTVSTQTRISEGFSTALNENSASSNAALQKALNDRIQGAGKPKDTVDPNALQHSISLQQQQLGLYGQTITAAESVKQIELQVQSARLQGVAVDEKRIDVLKRLAVEQSIGTAQIKAQADAEKINAATIGMSVGQATEYTAVQNALNAAKQQGRVLTQDNIAAINKEAAALGEAAKTTDNLRFAYDSLVKGPLETFTGAIAQGASAMDALKQAGVSALNAIAKKLADMAADKLWQAALGGSSGGLFGGLGSLLGFGSGSSGTGNFTNIAAPGGGTMPFAAAGGGTFGAGSWGVVGEKGPELIKVGMGNVTVIPNHISKPYLPGFATGGTLDAAGNVRRLAGMGQDNSPGGAQQTHVTVGVAVDDTGNLQAYVKSISTQTVNDFANSPQFPNHVAKASNTARAQRLGR